MENKEMDIKEKQKRERDERAAKRSQLREAAEEEEATSKKPRLDLLDVLNSSSSILDILTASGRKPLPTLSENQINKETGTGNLSSTRPGILDIFEAVPNKEGPAEDKEAVEVGQNLSFSMALLLKL